MNFTLYSGQSLKMNGLTSFLVAFSFPWHGRKTKCGIQSHKRHKVEKIDLSVLLFQVMKEPISSLTNYFMVYVFGWPDPNTRESCES